MIYKTTTRIYLFFNMIYIYIAKVNNGMKNGILA